AGSKRTGRSQPRRIHEARELLRRPRRGCRRTRGKGCTLRDGGTMERACAARSDPPWSLVELGGSKRICQLPRSGHAEAAVTRSNPGEVTSSLRPQLTANAHG